MVFTIDPDLIENNNVRITTDGTGNFVLEHVVTGNTITLRGDNTLEVESVEANGEVAADSATFQNAVEAGSVNTDEVFTMPAGVRLTKDINQTVSSGSSTTITWDSAAERNQSADSFADLSSDGITIPNDKYSVARLSIAVRTTNPITWELMDVLKNGSGFPGRIREEPDGVAWQSMTAVSDWFSVSSGDTITARFEHSEGNTQDIDSNADTTWLSLEAY